MVSQLRHQLLNNPSTLEIRVTTNLAHSATWFDWLASQPETAFSMPLTRSLSVAVDLGTLNGTKISRDAELIPTKAGDPVLAHAKVERHQGVVLTALAAEELNVQAQDQIRMIVTRINQHKPEKAQLVFIVDSVLLKKARRKELYLHL